VKKLNIDAEDVLSMTREAELIGAYKALYWLSFEFTKGMNVEDIEATVDYMLCILGEEMWDNFSKGHGVLTHLSDRMEKRLKVKVTTE